MRFFIVIPVCCGRYRRLDGTHTASSVGMYQVVCGRIRVYFPALHQNLWAWNRASASDVVPESRRVGRESDQGVVPGAMLARAMRTQRPHLTRRAIGGEASGG
ncbi:MAG TPA: hypothetical protein VKP30_03965, partial [Polyangiaceae bacterium]|nr:hypothetical protein [Polyangiaceae bacterium]